MNPFEAAISEAELMFMIVNCIGFVFKGRNSIFLNTCVIIFALPPKQLSLVLYTYDFIFQERRFR